MNKYSRQRELILEAVKKNRVHPTADCIYNLLKEGHPGLSLGTVYRNLNFLAEDGQIQKIKLAEGPDRFDGELFPHLHMACTCCGGLVDLPAECAGSLPRLTDNAFKNTGHRIESYSLTFFGICKACREKKN